MRLDLLPQAEAPEQGVEHVFNAGRARESVERRPSCPQILGDQHNIAFRINGLQSLPSIGQSISLAAIERDRILWGQDCLSSSNDTLDKVIDPLPGGRRYRQRSLRYFATAGQIHLGMQPDQSVMARGFGGLPKPEKNVRALDRITGKAGVEDMLDALFGRFCIGK